LSPLFALAVLSAVGLLAAFTFALRRASIDLASGAAAPDFALETFDGETIRLADLRGRVVVVNFWASWCLPCAEEAADLEAVWRDYRDRGVTVLGVDYTDTRPAALAYLEAHGITYPNGMDRANAISRRYKLTGVPETAVIDRAGRLVGLGPPDTDGRPPAKFVGPIVPTAAFTPADLRATLDRLLAEASAGAGGPRGDGEP